MSALGTPVLINTNRAYWLSSIGSDVIHSTIVVDELDANVARVSTLVAENITASTVNVSSLNFETSDVSGMYVSSIRGNDAFFSSLTIASDLSGGLGYVRFHVDASGVQVDGDPIRFDNLVYLTSTINIIQVSTLVDTDIFAQRGFFSTLSTGNLTSGTSYLSSVICDDISGNNGSFDRLFVSSLEALDISGVAASNWSIYPTLNSSITFQPGFVLSNVGPTLFFAGVELTDISGGGQDWARFPAVSTVQMNNNSLGGLSTLTFQDGGRLYSQTGNNLFYNNQQLTSGAGGAASNWAQYPANNNVNMNNSNLSNVSQIFGSNLALSGSNVTNGNTFTNSLGVGGLSLLPIASITSGGDLSCRNIEVGDSTTSLADVNIYGVNALPGDNALYVIGGTTLTGGLTAGVPVHGTEIGASPIVGVDSMRIDVLPVGIGINAATYVQVAAAGAGSFAAGGALSLSGGDYVEINTDDCRIINTTSGNQSTTLTVANIQMPGSVAATVPLQINNTAGGGINLVGTSGKGQIAGFSSIAGDNLVIGNSTITDVLVATDRATANNLLWNLGLGVSTVSADYFGQRLWISDSIIATTNLPPIDAQIIGFSTIQGGQLSCINLTCSTINGAPPGGGGGGPTVSSFETLQTSSLKVSTIAGTFGNNTLIGSTLFVEGGLQFVGDATGIPGSGSRFLSSVRTINNIGQNLGVFVSSMDLIWNGGINPNGYVRIGGGGAFDSFFRTLNGIESLSTSQVLANSTICGEITTSSLGAYGGLPIKIKNTLEFVGPNAVDNVAVINTSPDVIPQLLIGASTITLGANNVFTTSLSTVNHSTSAFNFSTARSYQSNVGYNYPLFIEADHAGGGTNASGVAIAVQGHNLGTGAVRNQIEMGARGSGENYIMASWPGQNLEELFIDATDVQFRDGAFSTIVNLDPYGLITNGAISAPALLVSSINGAPVGGSVGPDLSVSSLSTQVMNLSTIQMYDDSGTYPPGQSSIMNIQFTYNGSNGQQGFSLENYVNTTDNLDIYLTGNADGAQITSWTNNRSSFSELFLTGNTVTINVDNSVLIGQNGGPITYSEIGPTFVSTQSLTVSSINGNDANPAYTNNIQLSTMELFAGSTTLLYWDSTTTSSNINTSAYDTVVGLNGTFKIGASLQLNNQSGTDQVEFFFLKNDSVISNAGGIVNVLNNDEILTYCEIIEPLVNGDKIQVGCYTRNSNVYLSTINGDILQSPAAILTMYKVD